MGDPGEGGGVVGRLEDGEAWSGVVDTGLVLALGGGGAAGGVCGGVGGAGPAAGLTPDWLKCSQLTWETRPGGAGVVVTSLTRV